MNYVGTHELPDTKIAAVVDFYGPTDYGKLALARRDHPERFNMASIDRHAANGGGIHFFGVEQLDDAGLLKLRQLAPIAAVHKGMPPFLCIHGTNDEGILRTDAGVLRRDAQGGSDVRHHYHRGRRSRHERVEGAGHATLEARNDRVAEEDAEGKVIVSGIR